jgi:heme-degrading monooxygenase HmoA
VTTIGKDNQVVTLINVFTVEPEHQQRLVEMLVEATEQTIRHVPGYVSANIHRGLDGRHVANYAQWRSPQDFRAMLENPEAGPHMEAIRNLASNEGYLYELVYTDARELD